MNLVFEQIRWSCGGFVLDVSAQLQGQITGIFGPSGAGKTTLLEIAAGLRRPQQGRLSLEGRVLHDTSPARWVAPQKRSISYVPQDGALFPHYSVRGNLQYGSRGPGERAPTITFAHVVEVLELSGLMERSPATLSGGEKQRVALGRALLASPRLLLLDEPLAGLDASLKARVLPYLIRVRDEFGIPMLYVTHSPDEVMALCDDVLCLEAGRVVRHAAPGAIFEAATEPRFQLKRT